MKLPRRKFLQLAAGAAAPAASLRTASAQSYPLRPVRIIHGFAAGGSADVYARLTGQWLSERLGQRFIVERRPGGGSNIAAEAVVRAAADGYTLLWVTTANAVNTSIYEKLNFNFIRDITPIAGIFRTTFVMLVNPSFPANTVPEFIGYAKANPGKINMASGGTGTANHLAGELFKMMAGVDMVHVPYRGGAPAVTDLLGGRVQVLFDLPAESIQYIRAGKLRPLAVTNTVRSEALPDVPTVAEFVLGYEASGWAGLGAPRTTPGEVVGRLGNEISAVLADAAVKARIAEFGDAPLPGSPADFGKLIADETEKWGKVIGAANIKL
jgi:tripartite-type tricarboxylate transporter receptor subunit TctC